MKVRVALALMPLLLAAAAPSAAAQSAEAQELFDEGRRSLAAGDYTTACARLDASERIERAVGTLLSLAECEEALGQLADERLHLQEAASWADATHDPLNRGPLARKRLAEIDRRVPRLTLRRKPGAPPDSRVTRDGVDLGTAGFDAPLPVDAGRHTIVVSAPGYADARYDVILNERDQKTLLVGPSGGESAAPRSADAAGWSRRSWAYALGGVGIAGILVGSIAGIATISTWSDAQRDCGSGCPAGSAGQSESGQAHTDAAVSTVAFAAGVVALGAAAYLVFAGPHDRSAPGSVSVAPWIGAGSAGATVGGTWQ